MRQVIVIGGGEVHQNEGQYIDFISRMEFNPLAEHSKNWKSNLQSDLGEEYQVLKVNMPTPLNADYLMWCIWFEKYLPYLNDDVILVGHSLGALFLIKYLDEQQLLVNVRGTFLVAPPFARIGDKELSSFGFEPKGYLMNFKKQAGQVYFYQGRDDEVVPYHNYESYRILVPSTPRLFPKRGHFIFDEHFPELVRDIKSLT